MVQTKFPFQKKHLSLEFLVEVYMFISLEKEILNWGLLIFFIYFQISVVHWFPI